MCRLNLADTKRNRRGMYKVDDIGSTYASLPPSMQTAENECFAYALDRQIAKLNRLVQKLNIWGNLDEVDPKYYDALAVCVQVPYYRSDYSNEIKLKLIKSAPMLYRYAGTQTAIEKMLAIIFEQAQFIPWYEYGGKPYHFRIKVYDLLTEDAVSIFKKVLRKVKSQRSIIDEIEVAREVDLTIFAGCGIKIVYKPDAIKESLKDSNLARQTIHAANSIANPTDRKEIRESLKDRNSAGQTIHAANVTANMENQKEVREVLKTKGDNVSQTICAASGVVNKQKL